VSTVVIITVLLVGSCINELVLKPCINEPRPPMTANRDADDRPMPGMPSGHVFNSQTLCVWYLLLVVFEADLPPAETVCLAALLVAAMPLVPWARWYNGEPRGWATAAPGGSLLPPREAGLAAFVLAIRVLLPVTLHTGRLADSARRRAVWAP
ncbi:unnamed protein product, partial [Prorocentrum cordatum]